jgi:hypothetical protein
MVSNKFLGVNIFFRFNNLKVHKLTSSNNIIRIIPITKLSYIDIDNESNKMQFYFNNSSTLKISNKYVNKVLTDITNQINNGQHFIDI